MKGCGSFFTKTDNYADFKKEISAEEMKIKGYKKQKEGINKMQLLYE